MPQTTKTFRLFVSSTFSDMQEERRILQNDVFPKLEKLCREKGAKFQAVDLRWGVNEESQLNQKTMDICLGEIARCQQITPKPNFIVLLGERYGWQPIPYRIPEEEMKEILKVANEDMKLLATWYRLDKNALPSEYILQPRGKEHLEYRDWAPVEDKILQMLRDAVDTLQFSPEQRIKYFTSATHQEIINGALQPPDELEYHPQEHVFAYLREISSPPENDPNYEKTWLDHDKNAQTQLVTLKTTLQNKLGDHCSGYMASWDDKVVTLKPPKNFGDRIFNDLAPIIQAQLEEIVTDDVVVNEVANHQEMQKQLCTHFTGRKDELVAIRKYLEKTESKILSLIGASGSGKTSLMAKAINMPQKPDAHVFYRFLGTTSRSTNTITLLQLLCKDIAGYYDTSLESLLEEGHEQDLYELNGLTKLFHKCLELAEPARPLILFLDALDQLAENDPGRNLSWLPHEISPNVRVVVSALPELAKILSSTTIINLPSLPVQDAEKLLRKWLSAISRTITPDQQEQVLSKFVQTGLPIYLKLAFERARTYHSYTPIEKLPSDIAGILDNWLIELKNKHTEILVNKVLQFMLCGKYQGLTENEILDLLVFDDEHWQAFLKSCHPDHRSEVEKLKKIPIVVWSRLYLDLEPYLTERDADGESIICFYHRQFNELVGKTILADSITPHQLLANYFHSQQPLFLKPNSLENPNVRKVTEQPFQQTRAEMWKDLEATLCNLIFLQAKCVAGNSDEMFNDYAAALDAMPYSIQQCMQVFKQIFSQELHHIRQRPDLTFQQMYNQLQWYDDQVKQLAEKARWTFTECGGTFLWQYRTPQMVESNLKMTLTGHTDMIISCSYSPDGRRIVSGGYDNTLKIWDAETGSLLADLIGHKDDIISCSYSPNGRRIVSGSSDLTLKIWNAETGSLLTDLTGHKGGVTSCSYSPDGTHIVSGSYDNTLKIWDAETGGLLIDRIGHTRGVSSCSYSPDGRCVVSGSWDGALKIWDAKTGSLLADLIGHKGEVSSCSYSPNGRCIVSGSDDNTLKIWDAKTGILLADLIGHKDMVTSCNYSPNGRCVVSGSSDDTLKIWDAETGIFLADLKGNTDMVNSCSYSPNGRRIISGSSDNTLKIWNSETGSLQVDLTGNADMVNSCSYSPDGRHIVSGNSDNTLKIWDAETGSLLADLIGHKEEVLSCSYSSDGRSIVSGSSDGALKIWDAETGSLLTDLKGHPDWVLSCSYSPDGRRIVSGSSDNTLKIWDAETGSLLANLKGHTDSVNSCSYSPDGLYVVSGSSDHTLKIWNAETGLEIALFYCAASVYTSAVSGCGKKIVCGDAAGNLYIIRPEGFSITEVSRKTVRRGQALSESGSGVRSGVRAGSGFHSLTFSNL